MFGWLATGSGRPVMAGIIKIAIILLLATLVSELVNMAIEHYLRDTDAQGRRIYHSGRMRTLLPLLRNAFRIALGVMVLMVVLSEIGLDIAPLLAAAGVVDLAVGFGAQTLVKDIITGVFILLEDTIAIGDVIDFLGLKVKPQAPLAPAALMAKLELVLAAAARYVRQIPAAELRKPFRNRNRPIRALAFHVGPLCGLRLRRPGATPAYDTTRETRNHFAPFRRRSDSARCARGRSRRRAR